MHVQKINKLLIKINLTHRLSGLLAAGLTERVPGKGNEGSKYYAVAGGSPMRQLYK